MIVQVPTIDRTKLKVGRVTFTKQKVGIYRHGFATKVEMLIMSCGPLGYMKTLGFYKGRGMKRWQVIHTTSGKSVSAFDKQEHCPKFIEAVIDLIDWSRPEDRALSDMTPEKLGKMRGIAQGLLLNLPE